MKTAPLSFVALALVVPSVVVPSVAVAAGVKTVDLSKAGPVRPVSPTERPAAAMQLSDLDAIAVLDGAPKPESLHGTVVSTGSDAIASDVGAVFAVEDIPGNEYPRKHTLYMNFIGEDLKPGSDNSAENRSSLASSDPYPAFFGGEQTAIASAQEVQNDLSAYGIRVFYDPNDRPPAILPYTMAMIGGSWQDTNLEDPAGGVAPGTDCGALGQRHVVYTFAGGGWGATAIANVTGQEAGHAWGLDHSLNCGSVMSYCGAGNGNFSNTCDGLCENACQGAAGCRSFHEMFCGEGSDQQNEAAELNFIFGGNEPDIEPPYVEIQSPTDGAQLIEGDNVDLRAIVDDNYGGYGWSFLITRDGEVLLEEVDYDRDVDPEYRAALNLVNLEPGAYEITVTIMDQADQVSTDVVGFSVAPDPNAGADDGAADGGVDGGSDDGPGDGGDGPVTTVGGGGMGDGGGDLDDGGAEDGGTAGLDTDGASAGMDDAGEVGGRGCECAAGPQNRPGAAGLLLLLIGALRRRNR